MGGWDEWRGEEKDGWMNKSSSNLIELMVT